MDALSERIKEYQQFYNELRCKGFLRFDGSEELFSCIYDTGARANWINEFVLQSSFNEMLSFSSIEHCKREFGYDAYTLADAYEDLHINLCNVDVQYPTKEKFYPTLILLMR